MDKLDVPLEPLPPNLHPPVVMAVMQPASQQLLPPHMTLPSVSLPSRNQRHQRQEDWVTCLDCSDRPKPQLPDRWRLPKDDCIKCLKARSRALSADKTQIDNYVNHAYSRTGQLMLLMSFDPTKKELRIQGAPILVERILNHDVQGFLRRAVFEPAVADTDEARHVRACSFKKALPLLPRKGLHRMTQDELRSFIGPLVCAYADREQPGWSDDTKRIDCWPEGIPWGNPKHGSWKVGNEIPNSIFRRIIANIYHASGREDMLKPAPPICRGACEKCCGVATSYEDDDLPIDDEVDMGPHAHAHHQHHMEEYVHAPTQVVHIGPHPLSQGDQASLAAAAVAAAASAQPLPTVPVAVLQAHPLPGDGSHVLQAHQLQGGHATLSTGLDDEHAKRRRLEHEGWTQF